MRASAAEDSTAQPYNDMALHPFKRIFTRSPSKIFKVLSKPCAAWLILIFLGLPLPASGAEADPGWRSVALMPWQLIGLDAEFTLRHREQLLQMRDSLRAYWLPSSQTLDMAARQHGRTLSLNEQGLSHKIQVGQTRSTLQQPHQLQPIICPIGDYLMMAIELINTSTDHLLAAEHILVPRADWEQWQSPNAPRPKVPDSAWQTAMEKLLQAAQDLPSNVRENPFKLRLGLLRGSHDGRRGAHLCLNMLLAHDLAAKFTLLPIVGELESFHLRKVWDIQEPMLRATRELVIDWGMQAKGPKFEAEGRWSEAVLGSSIDARLPIKIMIDSSQRKLPNELIESLSKEALSLKAEDWPQVAKIYGAWVYLDRGRAWGLDMNDRLYLDDGQRLIKGHVVGFYGTGLSLVSPRGFPIHEGAIVFIRTGQKKVKLGDSFRFDPTHFPTPWPAVRQPSQASTP